MYVLHERKHPDRSLKQPKSEKGLRRGVATWDPPHIEWEGQASHEKHINWMQQQAKKRQYIPWTHKKMNLTFSLRREYLIKQLVPILQLKEKYPFLNNPNEVSSYSIKGKFDLPYNFIPEFNKKGG